MKIIMLNLNSTANSTKTSFEKIGKNCENQRKKLNLRATCKFSIISVFLLSIFIK